MLEIISHHYINGVQVLYFIHFCLPRSLLYQHIRISGTRPLVLSFGQLPTFCLHKQYISEYLCVFIIFYMHKYIHS